MNIIIAGAGKVGLNVAGHLVAEGHNVTLVDTEQETLDRASNQLDVMCVKGNGASRSALIKAGVHSADMVIAATGLDEINLLCCHCAKGFGVPNTAARVRSAEYAGDLDNMKQELAIDTLVNPELATAAEISRLLRFPNAASIDSFARGQVEIVSFHIQEGDLLIGKSLTSLTSKIRDLAMLFCAVERGGEVIIPNGSFVMQQGDKAYLVGTSTGINQFFKLMGRQSHKIRSAFIVGGGRISYYLIGILERLGISCKVIEKNEQRCRELAELFPKSLIIHGDGTDPELLAEECMESSDAFIALTNRDEDNLIISLCAHQAGVSKVIAKSNRQNYASIARSAGVESIVSPKLTTADHLLRMVRAIKNSKGNAMTALYRIAGGQAEAMEFQVTPATLHLGVPLKNLQQNMKEGILIAVIVRNFKVIIPNGSTALEEGDTVIVVARGSGVLDLNDIFEH